MVAVSGALSGIFVVIANAWMNTPRGFTLVDGKFTNVDPIAAMMTPAAFPQALHMTLAAYAATGFAVAGIHAAMLLRDPPKCVSPPRARDRAPGRRAGGAPPAALRRHRARATSRGSSR